MTPSKPIAVRRPSIGTVTPKNLNFVTVSGIQYLSRKVGSRGVGQTNDNFVLSDSEVKQILIGQYSSSFAWPYRRSRNGSRCGERCAYSRLGGASPLSHERDVADDMVARY